MWRIRDVQELQEVYRDLDTVAYITEKSLGWVGHVVRLDHGRLVKKTFESKPEGRRRMGRPRMRWLEDVEEDLRERKVERWRQKTVRMALLLTEDGKSVGGP
jgi:hypothetical protein